MILNYEAQDIMLALESKSIGWRSAVHAILALQRCAKWKRVVCWVVGHEPPVLIPIGGPSCNWWNICPRCGAAHRFRGESFLPLTWAPPDGARGSGT